MKISQPLYYCFVKDCQKTNENILYPIGVWFSPLQTARSLVGKRALRPPTLYAHHSPLRKMMKLEWKTNMARFDRRHQTLVWKKTSGGWLPGADIVDQQEWTPRHMNALLRQEDKCTI